MIFIINSYKKPTNLFQIFYINKIYINQFVVLPFYTSAFSILLNGEKFLLIKIHEIESIMRPSMKHITFEH